SCCTTVRAVPDRRVRSAGRWDHMTADGEERSLRKPMVTPVPVGAPPPEGQTGSTVKPTPADLGVDLAALDWQRSGAGHGSFEVAFVAGRRDGTGPQHTGEAGKADWVL